MNLIYDYDAVRDFGGLSSRMKFFCYFICGFNLLSIGFLIPVYMKDGGIDDLMIIVSSAALFLCFLIPILYDYRKIGKEGVFFIHMDEKEIRMKLNRFSKETIVSLSAINMIHFMEHEIIFDLDKGPDVRINLGNIPNEKKRDEFIRKLQDLGLKEKHYPLR